MSTPFLEGAGGDPASLQRRMAPQATRGIPAADSTMQDFLSDGGGFGIEFGTVPRSVISSGGAPRTPLPGKAGVSDNPLFGGDCDPVNRAQLIMLANVFGAYDLTDANPRYEWDFNLDGATSADPYITSYEDTDILPRTTFYDWKVNGFTVSASPNAPFTVQFSRSVPSFHFWGAPVQTSGSGSTAPVVLGSAMPHHFGTGAGTTEDLYVTLPDGTGPDITVDAKFGSGAAYNSNDQAYTLGDPAIRLLDETGGIYGGLIRDQPRVFWAAGATVVDGDEWQVPRRRPNWTTPSITEFPIPSVNTRFFVDGEEIGVEGGYTLEVSWETTGLIPDTFGLQGGVADRAGKLNATLTPTRQVEDLTLQRYIALGSTVSAVIDGLSDSLVTGLFPYRWTVVLPSLHVGGETYGVDQGGTNRQESATMLAGTPAATFNYDGRSFNSHCHVWIRNGISGLTA